MSDSLFSLASVFNDKGLVLWECFYTASGSSEEQARDAINDLIQNVLIQERSAESNKFVSERGQQDVRFVKDNQCGSTLVFALVIASALSNVGKISSMMERLIEAFRASFVSEFRSELEANGCDHSPKLNSFDGTWLRLQDELQQTRTEKGPRSFEKKEKSKAADDGPKQSEGNLAEISDLHKSSPSLDSATNDAGVDLSDEEKIARARAKLALKSKGGAAGSKALGTKAQTATPPKTAKKSWKEANGMISPAHTQIDYSVGSAPTEEKLDVSKFEFNLAIDQSSDEDDEGTGSRSTAAARLQHGGKTSVSTAGAADAPSKSKGWWESFMTMTGSSAVDAADIAPAVQQFKDMLIQKNVAADIAESITTAVCDSLVGKKISGIHGIKAAAKDAMEEALTKILTPKQSTDILSEIFMEKQRGNPYIICFVGVNGVGKSTTLAKVRMLFSHFYFFRSCNHSLLSPQVCRYIKESQYSVLIAACDTFRSGAVEQLRVHSRRLNTPLFEMGYAKDAAHVRHTKQRVRISTYVCSHSCLSCQVAEAAVKHAREEHIDVVLVDTAGRMQVVSMFVIDVMNRHLFTRTTCRSCNRSRNSSTRFGPTRCCLSAKLSSVMMGWTN